MITSGTALGRYAAVLVVPKPQGGHRNDDRSTNSSNTSGGLIVFFVLLGLVYLAVLVASIWAYVRIVRRTGFSGWWVLMGLVPIGNIVVFLMWAFREWPIQHELAALRAQVYGTTSPPPYGGPPGYGSAPGTG